MSESQSFLKYRNEQFFAFEKFSCCDDVNEASHILCGYALGKLL